VPLTRLRVRTLAHGGAAVAHPIDDGPRATWFVGGALPDEEIEAIAVGEGRGSVRGELQRVVVASPDRVAPPCPLTGSCGGCAWQHIDPAAQPRLKRQIVADQLRKLVPSEAIHLAYEGPSSGYRRRARLRYQTGQGGMVLGFRAPQSHALTDVERCMVLEPALDRSLAKLRQLADVLPSEGEIIALTDGRRCLFGLPGVRPDRGVLERLEAMLDDTIAGFDIRGARRRRVVGKARLDLDGTADVVPLHVGPFAFAQAQAPGGSRLAEYVRTAARPSGRTVLELHAGAGTFTRLLARDAQAVAAYDSDEEAIAALAALGRRTGMPIAAHRRAIERALPELASERFDVAVIDPPRAGLGRTAMQQLIRIVERRIVYVSCDPATLARDLECAASAGWTIADVAVFDLMPMTPHIEIVATVTSPPERRGG
jgi:tRNA/tmRNA/rRNA uracil-C5-methylase (TrmA/RlmC/RlmD family)